MTLHAATLLPLIGFAFASGWTLMRPSATPTAVALACAALLGWRALEHLTRGAAKRTAWLQTEQDQLRAALERSEEACASTAADLRSAERRCELALRGSHEGQWEWELGSDVVQLSLRWKRMLGFGETEIGNDKAAWRACIHAEDRAAYEQVLARHLTGEDSRFEHEARLLHKDGSVRQVLSRGIAIRDEHGAPYRMIGSDLDVTKLRRVETVLDAVAEATGAAPGPDFFPTLVQHFARAIGVDCAFIAECINHPATRVRTLGYWSAATGHRAPFEFDLAGTPCDQVINEARACFHREGVAQMFPREVGYEGYLGLPIIGSDGRVIGHLAFFNKRPLDDDVRVDSIFRIVLARAAAEMERAAALAHLSDAPRPAPSP